MSKRDIGYTEENRGMTFSTAQHDPDWHTFLTSLLMGSMTATEDHKEITGGR